MHFDLISDTHDNFWPKEDLLNFSGLGTSLVAVVAGDISNDWEYSFNRLIEMSKHYKHIIFIDGNHEHGLRPHLAENCQILQEKLANYTNITYLYKTCIVLDDTAFVGCNGWWTYDFCEPEISQQNCWDLLNKDGYTNDSLSEIFVNAKIDAQTLTNQITSFTNDNRVKNIVVITHTSPLKKFRFINPWMAEHHLGRSGSSFLSKALSADKNKKIKVWCFGHVHKCYDEIIDGIRYISNPRGRPEEGIGLIYYPKLIEI